MQLVRAPQSFHSICVSKCISCFLEFDLIPISFCSAQSNFKQFRVTSPTYSAVPSVFPVLRSKMQYNELRHGNNLVLVHPVRAVLSLFFMVSALDERRLREAQSKLVAVVRCTYVHSCRTESFVVPMTTPVYAMSHSQGAPNHFYS